MSEKTEVESPSARFLPTEGVRARYGVSRQTVWRWTRNPTLGFPAPSMIAGRPFWSVDDLERYERSTRGRAA